MKVIHIVEALNSGSVENWLVRMLRHARRQNAAVDWTFYCALGRPGAFDSEVRTLGARVVQAPVPIARKSAFIHALRVELRRGEYDVLHAHHDFVSAIYLLAAGGLPIRRRLVHVHNADEALPTPNPVKQALFRPMMRQMCLSMADGIVGTSNHTLDTFLAGRPRRQGRDTVHYCGVDPAAFTTVRGSRLAFRRELGLTDNARILLFAGRMVREKNPLFAVDVLHELHNIDSTVAGVFVGRGGLDDAVRHRAAELGLSSAFRYLGWRDNVPEIMSCCDCFILPHPERPMEGFGLAVVEAQLAGLRMMLSDGIADDPLLPTASFRRLPLSAGAATWAEATADLLRGPAPSPAAAVAALQQSPMDMDRALQGLIGLHG